MGSIFSIQCTDALSGRCLDCISNKSQHISRLEDNLIDLQADRDRLSEKQNDLRRTVIDHLRPQMEQSDQVTGWLSRANHTLTEAAELLMRGTQERHNLCMAGYCSTNCISTYKFGKSVARSLDLVNVLISEVADIEQLVVTATAEKLKCNLRELRKAKADLQARKEDLQQRITSEEGPGKRTLEEVKVWLSEAETLLAEADHLLEDGSHELSKLRGGDNSNSMFVGRVTQHVEDIRALKSQGEFSQVTAKAGPRQVVERNQRPTVGNEEMLEEAWSHLHKVEVGIIGIYGMGGVGKTTLLTQINNKFANNPNDFDAVIWVVVSKDMKLDKIQESIWTQIQSMDDRWMQKSFQEKAQDIFDVLRGKKFALLLDDVWKQFDLKDIGVPLPTQQNGSKVVLTTQSFDVCKHMEATQTLRVQPLNWEEAWQLFKEKVGEIDADILQLAQKVAEECRGLPIALITIGRAMASRRTKEQWEHALKVLRRSVSNVQGMGDELYIGMEVHVFERLKFSYDSLPNNILKSCFLYCSLFPKDFKSLKGDLIHYWAAEKYCGRSTEGYDIVYTLIRRCLLEEEGEYVKMHDVVRDMALYITSKCEKEKHMFFSQAGAQLTQLPVMEEWEGAIKVSFMENAIASIEESPRCCHLETLFLCHNLQLSTVSGDFFQFMTRLTVLDLSFTKIEVLPLGITKLQSLEYLNLSFTFLQTLPIEMKNLMRLKYLFLNDTYSLEMIPVGVLSNLSKLQVLNIFMSGIFQLYGSVGNNVLPEDGDKLMKELICLKNLSELSLSVMSVSFLQAICSNQILLNSVSVVQLCDFKTKSLNILPLANAKNLRGLDFANNDLEEIIMERRDTKAPGCSLNNDLLIFRGLREVVVWFNKSMWHITWLVFAPHLTILRVAENENMKEVINAKKLSEYQARGQHFNLFPKLQFLFLNGLPKLKTICPEALSFPCLTEIVVNDCPALKKLPLNSESAQGCNVVIKGEESWWNDLTWEDDQTRVAFASCFQVWV